MDDLVVTSSRRRVLELVQSAGRPVDIAELAGWTGLHPNTLRGHLQLLVDLGELQRVQEDRHAPGRPRVLYERASNGADADPYRILANELASGIAHAEGEGAAESAGRHWARRLRRDRPADERLDAAAATEVAADGLTRLGFTAATEPLGDRLYLTSCPFLELARENRAVCEVHAGLLRGLFDELGGQVALTDLDVFVRPDLCIAHLRRLDDETPGSTERTVP
jgi:predicted ArsR family transcriptional regulator